MKYDYAVNYRFSNCMQGFVSTEAVERVTTLDDEVYKLSRLCVRQWTPHQSIIQSTADGSLGALLALLPVSA